MLHARDLSFCHTDGELVGDFNHLAAFDERHVIDFFGRTNRIAILVLHDPDHSLGAHVDNAAVPDKASLPSLDVVVQLDPNPGWIFTVLDGL